MKILCCSKPTELGISKTATQKVLEGRISRLIESRKIVIEAETASFDSGFMEGDCSSLDMSTESMTE